MKTDLLRYTFFFFACLFTTSGFSQVYQVSGTLTDKKDKAPQPYVGVALKSITDTNLRKGATTDTLGRFTFNNVQPGSYQLEVSYMGFLDFSRPVQVTDAAVTGIAIELEPDDKVLNAVDIIKLQERVRQNGDTTEFNAGAYKVAKDATVEDLVNKMPGITMENGVLKSNGEEVKKVTIDGREFFGDDATMALKNLPAEIVDRVQVFDRQTDQAAFTGFSDGTTDKTLNIKTKSGKTNGTFGKVFAGYGTDEKVAESRYSVGGNINVFKNATRFSVLGMSNNINMQNFSAQDLLGVSQSSGGSPGGRGGGGRGGFSGGGRGGSGGAGSSDNFIVGQQNGVNTTHSFGLNYSDEWGKKIKASASYFFNATNNVTGSNIERQYFLDNNTSQFYNEKNEGNSDNMNHRFNMRLEWTIDTANSIILTPRLSFQQNKSQSLQQSSTMSAENVILNSASILNNSNNSGYTFSNNLLYRHKFAKRGRTFSLDLRTDMNDREGESNLDSRTSYYGFTPDTSFMQRSLTTSGGYTLAPTLTYTEPLSKKSQLMLTYNPSYIHSESEKTTNRLDVASDSYSILDSNLSNNFNNLVLTQRGGLSYRLNGEKYSFNVSADYQQLELKSEQTFPMDLNVNKRFENIVPRMFYRYKFSKSTNIRLSYNASTQTPSISQLQNVINNNNPLQLSAGNPDLQQQYNHNVSARFSTVDSSGTRPLFIMMSYTYSDQYIGNSTIIAQSDTVIGDDIVLNRGTQFSQPVNLKQGYSNIRTFITYGLPITGIKSNLNLNAGFTYSKSPGLINTVVNMANTYNMNAGLILGSNISEKIDFKLAYSANYYVVQNTIRPQLDNNYYTGVASARINVLLKEKWLAGSDVNFNHYAGLGQGFNRNVMLWNANIGYKFLKNNAGEIRLSVYDILKKNQSITRNVTETYVEDVSTRVLQRFFMLTFTYNLRNFKSGGVPEKREEPGGDGGNRR